MKADSSGQMYTIEMVSTAPRLSKINSARLIHHKCTIKAMKISWRAKIWFAGVIGSDREIVGSPDRLLRGWSTVAQWHIYLIITARPRETSRDKDLYTLYHVGRTFIFP